MPFSPAATPPLPSRRFRSLLTLGSLMALAACAQLPDLAERSGGHVTLRNANPGLDGEEKAIWLRLKLARASVATAG